MDDEKAETSEITMLFMIFQKLGMFTSSSRKIRGVYIGRCTGES